MKIPIDYYVVNLVMLSTQTINMSIYDQTAQVILS